MRRMRTGRDAAPEGSASSAKPPGASGDTARPNYMGPSERAGETDERRDEKPCGIGRSRERLLPFQKAVSGLEENAAAKRR